MTNLLTKEINIEFIPTFNQLYLNDIEWGFSGITSYDNYYVMTFFLK